MLPPIAPFLLQPSSPFPAAPRQIAIVVKAFKYPADTALAVGLNLSQIGEFVFVLLSMANQQSLLPESVYMLLMGGRLLLRGLCCCGGITCCCLWLRWRGCAAHGRMPADARAVPGAACGCAALLCGLWGVAAACLC